MDKKRMRTGTENPRNESVGVSVVIPIYNMQATIGRAIESVLRQDVDLEVVVVDDGSTDGSAEVVASYGDRIKYIHQNNAGPAAARNRGAQATHFPVLAFLDADDEFLPGCLKSHLACRQAKPGVKVTLAPFRVTEGEKVKREVMIWDRTAQLVQEGSFFYAGHFLSSLLPGVAVGSICVDRDILDHVGGFDTDLHCWEITEFIYRLYLAAPIVGIIRDVYVVIHHDVAKSQFERNQANIGYRFRYLNRILDHFDEIPLTEKQKVLHMVRESSFDLVKRGAYREARALYRRMALNWRNCMTFKELPFIRMLPASIVRLGIRNYRLFSNPQVRVRKSGGLNAGPVSASVQSVRSTAENDPVTGGVTSPLSRWVGFVVPSKAPRLERNRDKLGLPDTNPRIDRAIDESLAWLCHAQDFSMSRDGGVAGCYSLYSGWTTSYPETTGYIVPTMLAYASLRRDESIRERVKRTLEWLVSIQFPEGGFQGGTIGTKPVVPNTFNTGQILLGLASGFREFGEYRDAMRRAADWLVRTQDADGCWRKYPTHLAIAGEKTYETHAAWGLMEAARLEPARGYAESALANCHWALRKQKENGWLEDCCLTHPSKPLTHTLGYAFRGILEAYRFSQEQVFLLSAKRMADGLLGAIRKDGFLPGRLDEHWYGTVTWACLTGSAQIALCWLMLYQDVGDVRYRDAAIRVNQYLRRTMKMDGPLETRGAIKGSFPINGGYKAYQYPSWASKFFIDSSLLEIVVRTTE